MTTTPEQSGSPLCPIHFMSELDKDPVMPRLEPEAQAFLELALSSSSDEPPTEESIIQARAHIAAMTPAPPPERLATVGSISDLDIPGYGDDPIRIRVYRPVGRSQGIHVWFHGGAFVYGSAFDPGVDASMRQRCAATGAVVVNVDYRLAPEHRFPVGVEDAYAAVIWAAENARDLGSDTNALSVGGSSSGGNFAAAVSLMSRDRNGPQICLQLLEMPGTDLTKTSHAWRNPSFGHVITRAQDLALVGFYLADPSQMVHPYASPLLAPDLRGLPPAYVMSAEFDPLRDEAEAYVTRLSDVGIEAVARTMTGHLHGTVTLTDTWPPARAWVDEANAAIVRAHERPAGEPLFDEPLFTTHTHRTRISKEK